MKVAAVVVRTDVFNTVVTWLDCGSAMLLSVFFRSGPLLFVNVFWRFKRKGIMKVDFLNRSLNFTARMNKALIYGLWKVRDTNRKAPKLILLLDHFQLIITDQQCELLSRRLLGSLKQSTEQNPPHNTFYYRNADSLNFSFASDH